MSWRGGGGGLGLQVAHVTQPELLRQDHRCGGGGGGLGVQVAHVTRPELLRQDHRRGGGGGGLRVQAARDARPEWLQPDHRRGESEHSEQNLRGMTSEWPQMYFIELW